MGAVIFTSWSLFSAAGVGGESASPGDLRVSLFTVEFLPKIDPSRKWWCWPWKKISFVFFFCYSLLVDLYLLIVPKLRSAFLELQFCRRWASNFCCSLSSFFFMRSVKNGGIGHGRHQRPVIFFLFSVSDEILIILYILFFIKRKKRMNVGDVFNNSLNFLILRQTIFLGAGAICPSLYSVNADARWSLRVFSVPMWNCRGGLLTPL